MSIMRTGYTDQLLDKKVTTATDFLKLCLRNFAVLYSLRDEPLSPDIPHELPMSDYHTKQLAEAVVKLDRLTKLTRDEWQKRLDDSIAKEQAELDEYMKEIDEARSILEPILEEINAWKCDDNYQNVKDFAIDQIIKTMPTDDKPKWRRETLNHLKSVSLDDYIKSVLESVQQDIKYHNEELSNVRKSNLDANEYLGGFWKELNKLEGR